MSITKIAGLAFLLLAPEIAHAQQIPTSIALAALSPLVTVVLAILLGMVSGNWRVGTLHVGLLLVWIVAFLFTVQHVDIDYANWVPAILYAAHTLLILVLLVVHTARRLAGRDRLP